MARKPKPPVTSWYEQPAPVICPLCGRAIPQEQKDEHHLIPKSRGGRETRTLHRICHRQIHAQFSEAELERSYPAKERFIVKWNQFCRSRFSSGQWRLAKRIPRVYVRADRH